MAEILQRAGSWAFDGETVRIVPGTDRSVHHLRKSLGEVAVPLRAVAGIAHEPGGRKGGRLRLRLRDGADPLSQVASGRLPDASDPYQLAVDKDRTGVAEYMVEEVRNALLLEEIPDSPCDRYLLPGPPVPLTATGTDGTVTFDGEHLHIEWNWIAEESKTSGGPRRLALQDLTGVDWTPAAGWENGCLRFRPRGTHPTLKPQHDPNCLLLWGVRQARETGSSVLLAAAVAARLPHPLAPAVPDQRPAPAVPPPPHTPLPHTPLPHTPLSAQPSQSPQPAPPQPAPSQPAPHLGTPTEQDGRPPPAAEEAEHDGLLRRLRELGELRDKRVLTDQEFTVAKKAILDRF